MSKKLLLKGIRVLDYSRILVGSYASMLLADLGAEVIKIESKEGDETRKWGPPFKNELDSIYYLSLNRNKKSIVLDLKKEESIKVSHDLIKKSDIFIENFIHNDKLKQYQLDYDSVSKISQKLIYASVNAYGAKGPLSHTPGFDFIIQSYAGIMNITGDKETSPYRVGFPVCDILTASHLYSAILAALLHRNIHGEGQHINTSLLEVSLFANPTIVSNYLNAGLNSKRQGNDHPSIAPYTIFRLKDKEFISIGVATDLQFRRLFLCLNEGNDEADKDVLEKFQSNKMRVKLREELKDYIQGKIERLEPIVLFSLLKSNEIPFSKINSMQDLFNNYDQADKSASQVKALDIIQTVETENYGKLRFIKNPVTYDKIQLQEIATPPLKGEHTDYILRDILGYSELEINKLKLNNVLI